MKMARFFLLLLVAFLKISLSDSAREKTVLPLTDEGYNIMFRKIMGQSSIPVIEKTKVDRKVERKYYRWLKQGRSLTVWTESEDDIY